ncbi:hypothetical protein JCGZ_21010 [Jatropha curcas]|uniref:Uncharacterized protein n=1 Tax=Jatropha curcas TaxID=180498 RepID=A0A067K657_JATCU|nr:hypothetical protein JCGZ_21010 [Jatropha curcas]
MAIQAKEDLEIIETHHPNHFEYLKTDLKTFISVLESQQLLYTENLNSVVSLPTSSHLVAPQASTCEKRKKRKGFCRIQEPEKKGRACRHSSERLENVELKRNKDKVDLVLERV